MMKRKLVPGCSVLASAALVFAFSGCDRQPTESEVGPRESAPPIHEDEAPMKDAAPPPDAMPDEARDLEGEAPSVTKDYSGVLTTGFVGIGGEHTGWVLAGAPDGDYEVDVSAIAEEAAALQGQKVVITGRLVSKDYLERGPTFVLMAESIRRAG